MNKWRNILKNANGPIIRDLDDQHTMDIIMSYTYDEEEDAIEKASRQAFLDTQAKVVELQAKLILATKSKDEYEEIKRKTKRN